ncbi:MAG: glycosyltransferase family 9 protein [Planctomycetota bacterium]
MAKQRLPKLAELGGSAARNVLFFHHGGLGDFVLTWPLLLGAARVLAQSRVIAVVGEDRGKLAEQVLRVEYRDVEAGWSGLFGTGKLADRPAKLLSKASHVISLVAEAGSAWESQVRKHAPEAEVLMLMQPPRGLAGEHAIDHLLGQIAEHPLLHGGAMGIMESIGRTGLMPRLFDKPGPVVLHVGSGSPAKNWPIAGWIDLANHLRGAGRRVKVIAGEAERERLSADELASLGEVSDVQTPRDLSELLFLLRGAGLFIGHDTGPTHLAAMCGLPTHALFGPKSDPQAFGPVGPRVQVQHVDDLEALPVEGVVASLAELEHDGPE